MNLLVFLELNINYELTKIINIIPCVANKNKH